MHSPRPYGLLSVGGELTEDDSAAIELLARRLTNLKETSGVESLRMVRSLPDGGYAIAQDMGGTFRVIAHKPEPQPKAPPFDGLAKDYVPMLFSGTVTRAVLREGEGLGMKFTEQTRRRINNYVTENLPPKDVSLRRFRVEYNTMVSEFVPKTFTQLMYTQYVQQRPTWYSGAMAEVMQVVGGYGRQDLEALPDDSIERARLALPDKVLLKIREQIKSLRLPGYTGLPDTSGQFQYDYKFNNTDGISFDDKQKPWLIKINPQGVWAMPFPLIPATCTQAFREYMDEVGDQEIIDILERFGGMPSGESFPRGNDFQTWRRAGVVIKVCDVGEFYQQIAYYSGCGWSFNLNGTEGFNTCYDYDDDGIGLGLAFKLKLRLGSASNQGKLTSVAATDDPVKAARFNVYMSALLNLLNENTQKTLAIKYKLRRSTLDEILERANSAPNGGTNEVDYWDNLELPPISGHTGNVALVGRGYIFHRGSPKLQPQIKFPEPFMGGCVSHDFGKLENSSIPAGFIVRCDTIMFGYYVGDSLKVVKYFLDQRQYVEGVQDDYEECMIVGSWTRVVTTGSTSLNGNFYTTEIDQRAAFAPTITTIKTVGTDKGYDSKPFFEFDFFFWKPGTMWRNRYFTHKVNTETTEGRSLNIGVCIPYLCRNAVLHAKKEGVSGANKRESLSLYHIQDPTSYRYWTYDFIFAWAGGLEVMNGKPYPKDGNPVWVEIENYNPSTCSDFADQGPWVPALPADYTWLIHPNRNEWNHSGGGGAPKVKAYSTFTSGPSTESGNLMVEIFDGAAQVHLKTPSEGYFTMSPSEFGDIFYRDGCKVLFGNSEYANVSEEGDGGRRKYWGYTSLVDHRSAHHFIGVINE